MLKLAKYEKVEFSKKIAGVEYFIRVNDITKNSNDAGQTYRIQTVRAERVSDGSYRTFTLSRALYCDEYPSLRAGVIDTFAKLDARRAS